MALAASVNIDIAAAIAVSDNHGAAGQFTVNRSLLAGQIMTASELHLTSWLAPRSETVNTITTWCNAAGVGPTLQRMGIYTINDDGSLTLVGNTANDATLWLAAQAYVKTMAAPLALVAGQRYALGTLAVVAATAPTLVAAGQVTGTIVSAVEQAIYFSSPWKVARVATQTDLVVSYASNLVVVSTSSTGPVAAKLSFV